MNDHPDRGWVQQLLDGIQFGVSIRHTSEWSSVEAPNLPSAYQFPHAVDQDIEVELKAGRLAGPFTTPPFQPFRCNPVGVVEKDGGKSYRIIDHLSYPRKGGSVNSGIQDFSVVYPTISTAAKWMRRYGNAWMSKVDLKSAFRQVAVRQEDYGLLGFKWKDAYYYRRVLPFGSRSSPAIFASYAEAIAWIGKKVCGKGHIIAYLDDFLLIAKGKEECEEMVQRFRRLLNELGVEENVPKHIPPSQVVIYLGIELDAVKMEARLDKNRLSELKSLIKEWSGKSSATKLQLQSLIGKFSFASRCVQQSRLYLRRLIDLIPRARRQSDHIHIGLQAKKDIEWWNSFISDWNGVSLLPAGEWHMVGVRSDASGWGCGAIYGTKWIQKCWSAEERKLPMPVLEMMAVVFAILTWARELRGMRVCLESDCLPSVLAFNNLCSKSAALMDVVRVAHYVATKHDCAIRLRHVDGLDNQIADSISRNKMAIFKKLAPYARRWPQAVPPWPIQSWL